MGRKSKNDYKLRLTNYILRRVTAHKEGKKYGKLIKEVGYLVRYCGRDVGICEVNGIWMAIDLTTGLRVDSGQGYKKKGNLINFLKKNVAFYENEFNEFAKEVHENEVIFDKLKSVYEYGRERKKV